jgi:hypothetical protein
MCSDVLPTGFECGVLVGFFLHIRDLHG